MIDALARSLGLNITEENFLIRAEQIRALVQAYPSMITANMVMAPLVAWLMWSKIDHGVLLVWIAMLYAFHMLEIRHWLNYPKSIHSIQECKRWQRQFLSSDFLVGAAWGSTGIFMFIPGDPLFQALLLCILLGMAAGAVAGNLVFPLSQQTYVALVILPVLFNIVQQGVREYYLLAAMICVFLIFVMKVGFDQSKLFELSIRRGFENTKLASESKLANEQLRLSDEFLRQTQSVAKLGSWRLFQQENKLLWSDETYRIFGIPVGTPLNDDDFMAQVHPADRTMLELAWQAALKSGRYFVQHRIIAGGEPRWVEERAELEFDAQGNFSSAVGSVQDITERKLSEEQQLKLFEQLEEKGLAKTRFLAAAGHDLRQPVTAANMFVETLKLTSPSKRQLELIEKLDEAMKVFSNMLNRLLDISKFDAGLIKPQIASLELSKLFNWLNQEFSQTATDRGLSFHLFYPARKSLIVRTDIFLLQSVLRNLISNAIKFTERGRILVSARRRGDNLLFQVWDSGIGIDAANLPHIFDEFYQVANPQRNREAGLGLGLSICQRAMQVLEGKVSCRSIPGRGTIFEFSQPLNGKPHRLEQLPIIPPSSEVVSDVFLSDKRIVLVEDDVLVASSMVRLLRESGAEVMHFYNAEEALEQDDIVNADYFIVDYALGGELSGIQFLETVQVLQQPPVRAVIVTGETSSQFISSVVDSPWPVLYKPINCVKLIACLRNQAD